MEYINKYTYIVDRNGLTDIEAGAFAGLSSTLTTLDLSGNYLTGIQRSWTVDLASLTSLMIKQAQLYSIDTDAFSVLTKLTSLYLDSNQLTDIPDGVFASCTKLTLVFAQNSFST